MVCLCIQTWHFTVNASYVTCLLVKLVIKLSAILCHHNPRGSTFITLRPETYCHMYVPVKFPVFPYLVIIRFLLSCFDYSWHLFAVSGSLPSAALSRPPFVGKSSPRSHRKQACQPLRNPLLIIVLILTNVIITFCKEILRVSTHTHSCRLNIIRMCMTTLFSQIHVFLVYTDEIMVSFSKMHT